MTRLISFNVAGLRAMKCKRKDGTKLTPEEQKDQTTCLHALIAEQQPDVLALLETKNHSITDLDEFAAEFPHRYLNCSKVKKGYSGVALLCKQQPQWVSYDFEQLTADEIGEYATAEFLQEGRMITAKYAKQIVIAVYVVNSKEKLARIQERLVWEAMMRMYIQKLTHLYPEATILLTGDFNVAATDQLDLHRKQPKNTAGASDIERAEFQKLLVECGMVDSFRHLHPNRVVYTYWSNFARSRERNAGWRIDGVLVLSRDASRILEAECLVDYKGSDHCPVLCDFADQDQAQDQDQEQKQAE